MPDSIIRDIRFPVRERSDLKSRLAGVGYPLLAYNYDPNMIVANSSLTDGQIIAQKLWIPQTTIITGLVIYQGDTLLTNADNWNGLALYDSAGTLIAKTADRGADWASGTNALKAAALLKGPHRVLGGPDAYVYACLLGNTNAGVMPKFGNRYYLNSAATNLGQSAGATTCTLSAGVKNGQAAFPTATNGLYTLTSGGIPFWIAVY